MLIPSIDLMGGKIVQLIQGKKKALEFDNFEEWIVRFSKYPLVQLIDLDAAMGRSDNFALVREIAKRLPCQMGGGIRSLEAAKAALEAGARRVIVRLRIVSGWQGERGFCRRSWPPKSGRAVWYSLSMQSADS